MTSSVDLAVLDYGMGNLHSVAKAIESTGANARLVEAAGSLGKPDAIVLPGVGNFGRCAENLRRTGLDDVVVDWVGGEKPFLGICVGMQLLFGGSDEAGEPGLSLLPGRVVRIPADVRVPHMGWDTVRGAESLVGNSQWFYFVHSFAAIDVSGVEIATCEYGIEFVAALRRNRLWATQFHPEKSGTAGLDLLSRFVAECA